MKRRKGIGFVHLPTNIPPPSLAEGVMVVEVVDIVYVDAASDNFLTTRRSIHACCASMKDGGSASAGSDVETNWLELTRIKIVLIIKRCQYNVQYMGGYRLLVFSAR